MSYSMAWQNETAVSVVKSDGADIVDVYVRISDKELVELVLNGEETAFEQIFDRYKRLVAMIASRYFRQPEQIEEVIQISFTKAFFELKKFRGSHDLSLPSWLGKITANSCLDILRRQKRRSEDLLCELSDAETNTLLEIAAHDHKNSENLLVERDLAAKLLSCIGPEDRAVLQMLHSEGLSVDEIANTLNWSRSKVKLRAWRARNAMRKVLRKFL
jgi:RNA polymerase sigma-70 factor (ECF subfamily)